jgi:hypothetical protein
MLWHKAAVGRAGHSMLGLALIAGSETTSALLSVVQNGRTPIHSAKADGWHQLPLQPSALWVKPGSRLTLFAQLLSGGALTPHGTFPTPPGARQTLIG